MYAITIQAPGCHGDTATVIAITHAAQIVRCGARQCAHYVPGNPTDDFAWALGAKVPNPAGMGAADVGPNCSARVPIT